MNTTTVKKVTAKTYVKANAETLKDFADKVDRKAIITIGQIQFNSRIGFSSFKKALVSELGIDIDLMGMKALDQKTDLRLASKGTLKLYSDAKASKNRYAIVDQDGEPIWYGLFFANDRDYESTQASGELAAAKKAIWLAGKVVEKLGHTITLDLHVDAEWLTWGTATSGRGGKALVLGQLDKKMNVDLRISWVKGTKNPADQYTTCHGYKPYDIGVAANLVK